MSEKACVVIIGGTSGIGRAVAEMFATRGNDIVIAGRNETRAQEIAAEIGGQVTGIALDLAQPEQLAERLQPVGQVKHLIITAVERDANSVRDYNIQGAKRLAIIKLVGYTEVVHALLSRMTQDASIVLFGGLAKEKPYPGSTTVTSVNGGITSMVRTLAIELAPIRVNAVHPGVIGDSPAWVDNTVVLERTRARTPGGRLTTTEDVVGSVDFLLNNKGVNGVNLFVDCGWVLM